MKRENRNFPGSVLDAGLTSTTSLRSITVGEMPELTLPTTHIHLPVQHYHFCLPLRPHQLPAFRGAIAEFAGYDEECFHNHDGDAGGFHYGYPLIQYHIHQGLAAITAIGEGAAAMERLLRRYDGRLWMERQWQRAEVQRLQQAYFPVGTTDAWLEYDLRDWVPMNDQNYAAWRALPRQADRLQMLEKVFVGNVLTFGRAVGWQVERRLEAQILHLGEPRWCKRHRRDVLAFNLRLRIQALLPEGIGLGKGVSLGYGRIEH